MASNRQFLIGSLAALLISAASSALAVQPSGYSQRATFTAPFAHPSYASRYEYPAHPQPFRWGWFGAEYHPPAPMMHRDYNDGWREWHYRR